MILIDTNEQAIDEILKGVELLIDKKIKEATFDKTEKGQIIEVNSDDTYTIKINGMEYSKVKSSGASFNVGDIVSVIIPKNNYSLMYIDEIVLVDIQNSLYNKVDKIDGKGLSTNDYTTVDKEYVDNLKSLITTETDNSVDINTNTKINGTLTVGGNPVYHFGNKPRLEELESTRGTTLEIGSCIDFHENKNVDYDLKLESIDGLLHSSGDIFVNGEKVYHTGNKPTSKSIGAVANGGEIDNLAYSKKYMQVETETHGIFGIDWWASDRTLKENIKDTQLVKARDVINRLEHKQFDWKDSGEHVDIGYIADDIAEIYPQFIFEVPQGDRKSIKQVDKRVLIPVITKAIQELIAENESLKSEISTIKQNLTWHQNAIDMLIQQINS